MDFTVSDINSSLLNMFQTKTPNTGNADLDKEQFLGQLKQIIQKYEKNAGQDYRAQGSTEHGSTEQGNGDVGLAEVLGESMENEEGIAFLTELKSLFLTLSNGNLENLSINSEGLDSLGQLLVKAGFDPESVDKLMADLSIPLEEGREVTVSDFMDKLFDLPREDEVAELPETENMLTTADVPYMYSLFEMMGIDREKISEILAEASRGNQGISLDTTVDMLRQLDESSFSSGITYQSAEGDDSYITFFEQLGLELNGEDKGRLTLAGFITALEQKQTAMASELNQATGRVGDLAVNQIGNQIENQGSNNAVSVSDLALMNENGNKPSSEDLFGQLFKGLEISNSAASSEQANSHPDLLTGKIREQYKNDLINPVKGLSAEEGADKQPTTRIEPASLAAQVNQDGNNRSGLTGQPMDIVEKAGLMGKAKEEFSSPSDVNQAIQSGEKTSVSNSLDNGSLLKARQTFNSLPNHVTQQVGKNIVRAINLGENTLRVQLKPAELGRVFMTIDNNGDSMKVSIITENQSAKEILASNVNEIKTVLSASGISLEKFEVDMSSDFRQSMADARQQGQSNKRKPGKSLNTADDMKDEKLNNITTLSAAQKNSGALHFVA